MAKENNGASLGFESELWRAADALRSNMDAAEYKHAVLGLIFLKYISDAFEEQHTALQSQRIQGDLPGLGKSATLDDIRHHNHILTPGRYVGAAAMEEDGEPFEDKMTRLTAELKRQMEEGARLDKLIQANLEEIGYGL